MKSAAACLLTALALGGASAMAQAAGDPMDKTGPEPVRPRTASSYEGTATPESSWVVSETTSPIDHSPVVIATATARGAPDGSGMKISIACRGGTTSFVLGGPSPLPAGDRYVVSYAVDGGSATTLAATALPSGTGMALAGDVVRLLVSLPPQGEITFRMVGRQGATLEGRYSLAGLKTMRERMAVSCRWPLKPDTPRK
jgi:hypothetical protein